MKAILKDSRFYIGLVGIFLSIALHEAFHIAMHWDSLQTITLFPNLYTIVEVSSVSSHYYDTSLEELIAYSITLGVLLATTIAIVAVGDTKDTRSFSATLVSKKSPFSELSDAELIELAYKTNAFKHIV